MSNSSLEKDHFIVTNSRIQIKLQNHGIQIPDQFGFIALINHHKSRSQGTLLDTVHFLTISQDLKLVSLLDVCCV